MGNHTVEKIGGTSMSRFGELMANILIGDRRGAELYNRIFVVSAYGGVTNMLLEDKKTGAPGIYAAFASGDNKRYPFDKYQKIFDKEIRPGMNQKLGL